jgi:hypothetical protein
MKKLDRYGLDPETGYEDDGETVKDGRVVRVPMMMCDSQQRAVIAWRDALAMDKILERHLADAAKTAGLDLTLDEARALRDEARLDAAHADENAWRGVRDRVTRHRTTRDPKGRLLTTSEEIETDDLYDDGLSDSERSMIDSDVAKACGAAGVEALTYKEADAIRQQAWQDAAKADEGRWKGGAPLVVGPIEGSACTVGIEYAQYAGYPASWRRRGDKMVCVPDAIAEQEDAAATRDAASMTSMSLDQRRAYRDRVWEQAVRDDEQAWRKRLP